MEFKAPAAGPGRKDSVSLSRTAWSWGFTGICTHRMGEKDAAALKAFALAVDGAGGRR